MKTILILFSFTFCALFAFNQTNYDPTILVLSPFKTEISDNIKEEYVNIENLIKEYLIQQSKDTTKKSEDESFDDTENVIIIKNKTEQFSKELTFINNTSLISSNYIAYKFFRELRSSLIYPKNIKSDKNIEQYIKICREEKMQFIVNFPLISLFKKNNKRYAEIEIEVFDSLSKKVLLSKKYIGEDYNPGYEFTCTENTIDCCINNALSQGLNEVNRTIADNTQTFINQNELYKKREEILTKLYQEQKKINHKSNIIYSNTIKENSTTVPFAILNNQKQDKFMAFIFDKDYIDKDNQTLTLLVGINENNRWYYKVESTTFLSEKNIDKLKQDFFISNLNKSYFKTNTCDLNQDFYETYYFKKYDGDTIEKNKSIASYLKRIENTNDLKKKKMYQNFMIDIIEEKFFNKRYIGKYKIIVDEIEEKEREFNEKATEDILNNTKFKNYISVFCKNNNLIEEEEYHFKIIYPISANYFLIPTYLYTKDNKNEKLQYFLFLPDKETFKMYKWTYFNDTIIEKYGSSNEIFHDQLSKLTTWNTNFLYLDDSNFWEEYVFKKENGNYKYLKEM